jgi:hypothetical protein
MLLSLSLSASGINALEPGNGRRGNAILVTFVFEQPTSSAKAAPVSLNGGAQQQ